jgi:hypothetical protein
MAVAYYFTTDRVVCLSGEFDCWCRESGQIQIAPTVAGSGRSFLCQFDGWPARLRQDAAGALEALDPADDDGRGGAEGDKGTRRQGDRETGRQGEGECEPLGRLSTGLAEAIKYRPRRAG